MVSTRFWRTYSIGLTAFTLTAGIGLFVIEAPLRRLADQVANQLEVASEELQAIWEAHGG